VTDGWCCGLLTAADAPDVARLADDVRFGHDDLDSTPAFRGAGPGLDCRSNRTAKTRARKPPSPSRSRTLAALIGTVGLREINREHSHAELGLWIGVDWWGQGYATEAARALIRFAFEQPELNRFTPITWSETRPRGVSSRGSE